MKSVRPVALVLALLISALFITALRAEDWTTTDGKVYKDVKTVSFEPDAVTILYRDGGAVIPLANLPPDLQKRFNYDPGLARQAAERRAQDEAENAKLLQAETEKIKQLQQADGQGTTTTTDDENSPKPAAADQSPAPGPSPMPDPAASATPPDELALQLTASKIRLIGKIQSTVPGGCILGAVYGSDGYVIKDDPMRPDYQLVSKIAPQGTVYVATTGSGYKANDILDIDVYPVGKYIDVFGNSMLSYTTDASYARNYLKLKEHK